MENRDFLNFGTNFTFNNGVSIDIPDNLNKDRLKSNGDATKSATPLPVKAKWSNLLHKYALNTSFHGPRQFAEPQPFMIRRAIWLLLFLAGTTIFFMQTVISIQKYYRFPVSVNVKVNYNTSIIFPAVTICNGNAFRTTKAYEHDYYDLITEVYSGSNNTDLGKYGQTPDLQQLYNMTGHGMSDLIVSCIWNNQPCTEYDFVVTMTDLGKCYTFNSGLNVPQRKAYQTGTNGGLKLQLNTEQYEYMAGPNTGAGLKVLIHNPDDIPLVKDHGLAVPPGSHGIIGIKTSVVKNLPPKYGICNDSVVLEYFSVYSVENCYINCKENYFHSQCDCRDIYMPSKEGLPKACNINLYNTCMHQAQDNFISKIKETCQCPVPCNSVLHQTDVSYASISNFDIQKLLRRNSTSVLQQFIHSREITQRVNKAIVEEDKLLISNLNNVVTRLDKSFSKMQQDVQASGESLHNDFSLFAKRTKFHYWKALGGLKYVIEYNFIRGWDMYKERSFHYVILNFMDFPGILKSTIMDVSVNATISNSTIFSRAQLLAPLFAQFKGRKDLLHRAKDYVNTTNYAYLSDTPLLTYKFSYNRRYDWSYYSQSFLNGRYWDWDVTLEKINQYIDQMDSSLDILVEVGRQYIETSFFNETGFKIGQTNFIEGAKNFNYRMFLYEIYVVKRPLDRFLSPIIADFEVLNRTFYTSYSNVDWRLSQIKSLLQASLQQWKTIVNVTNMAKDYLNNQQLMKTPLGLSVLEKEFVFKVELLRINFENIKYRVSQLLDGLTVLSSSYKAVWTSMLYEERTKKFYKHLNKDCKDFVSTTNKTSITEYLNIFRDMLFRMPLSEITSTKPEMVVAMLNGDFAEMNITHFFIDFEKQFNELHRKLDLATLIGNDDVLFVKYMTELQNSLQDFVNGNRIGEQFFKQNFMSLDVFMKQLSYEEITQQEAYDIPQMLSEIGGSMGLFIGGSVLSAFEFLDVFVHYFIRAAANR